MQSRKVFAAKCAVILSVPILLYAFEFGPEPRRTGAPGDQTCAMAGCHVGTAVNSNGEKIEVTFDGGNTYTPGQTKRVTVRVTEPPNGSNGRFGFQMTARLASNESNGQAGRFTTAEPNTMVLCNDGSERGSGNCRSGQEVEFIEHSMPKQTGEWVVDWTAPATNVGDVKFYIAANVANGNRQNTGDRIYTSNFTLTPGAGGGGGGGTRPTISQGGVVNAGSGKAEITSAGWASLFGTNLAGATMTLGGGDVTNNRLPTTLGNVRVEVNGQPAFVSFVSATQVNFQVPDDAAQGNVNVTVINGDARSDNMAVMKQALSPGFLPFVDAQGNRFIAARHADFSVLAKPGLFQGLTTTPARPGEVILLFAVGFGPTNPSVPAGQIATAIANTTSPVTVRFGQTPAEVSYAGLSPGSSALYQLNVKVPETIEAGDIPVTATINGVSTQESIFITVAR